MIGNDKSRGIVLILAPIGRDAQAIAGLVERAGLCSIICATPQDLIGNLDRVIEVVVVAEEALYGNNVHILEGLGGPPASLVRSALYNIDAPE